MDLSEEIRALQLDLSEDNETIDVEEPKPQEVDGLVKMKEDIEESSNADHFHIETKDQEKMEASANEVNETVVHDANEEVKNKKRHLNVVSIGHVDAGNQQLVVKYFFLVGRSMTVLSKNMRKKRRIKQETVGYNSRSWKSTF